MRFTNPVVPGSHPDPSICRVGDDYYLATSDSGVTFHDLRHDHRTRHLRAVELHHFAIVPTRLVEPGAQVGTGLLTIARVLHPDAFR